MKGIAYVIIWIAGSFWVLYDAKKIGAKRDRFGGLLAMGPWGWFFTCLLLEVIGLVLYLFKRGQLKRLSEV